MTEKSWAQGLSSLKHVAFYIPELQNGNLTIFVNIYKEHPCLDWEHGLRSVKFSIYSTYMAQIVFDFIRIITCPSSSSWSYNPGFTVLASTWGTAREMMFYLMVGIANLRQHFQASVTTLKCYQCLPLRVKLGFVHNI